jgi:hypothetical protein
MRVGLTIFGSLKPTSAADRAHAARQHYIAESAIRTMGAYNRWTGEAMTGEIPARLSNAVMHLSLLDKWTDEGRRLFNKQVWAAITDNAKRAGRRSARREWTAAFADAHPLRLSESDWNNLRSTPLQEDGGAHWILPDNVLDQELSRRVAEMALAGNRDGGSLSSLRIRAAIDANIRKGTSPERSSGPLSSSAAIRFSCSGPRAASAWRWAGGARPNTLPLCSLPQRSWVPFPKSCTMSRTDKTSLTR